MEGTGRPTGDGTATVGSPGPGRRSPDRRDATGGGGGRRTAALTLAALGVVYGDIGTSPLYALRESFEGVGHAIAVNRENVLGVLSLIVWSLVVVVSVKYLAWVMRADDDGEGGILALTSLVTPRGGRLGRRRWWLIVVGLFGTALLYGDGMITPAISVLAAVEGTEVVTTSLTDAVIPLAVVILVGLFAVQRRGTGAVGRMFGPVMLVWFGTLAVLGAVHIADDPGVLASLNPVWAVRFFEANQLRGLLVLGSVFLVVTGAEALYADMGHFGARPIRLGWFGLVAPALVLNYLGQGASLLADPARIDSPFYRLAPEALRVPLVVLATAATVIASQALISGAYSLTMQATQLGYLPRVGIRHTSETERGQIYVPSVNWLLMVACVALVIGFGSSTRLAAAYGVAVTTTMVITTALTAVVARERWGWPVPAVAAVAVAFGVVDVAFLGANLPKIPHGGWFPLVVGAAVVTVFTTWRTGRRIVADRLATGRLPLEAFIGSLEESVTRVEGTAVYMARTPGAVPPALLANLRANHVIHAQVVIVTVLTAERPRVPPAARVELAHLGRGFHTVRLHYGYMDEPDVDGDLTRLVHRDLAVVPEETVYLLGKESLVVTDRPGMARWREHLFAVMSRNAANAADWFRVPTDRTFEVGVRVEL